MITTASIRGLDEICDQRQNLISIPEFVGEGIKVDVHQVVFRISAEPYCEADGVATYRPRRRRPHLDPDLIRDLLVALEAPSPQVNATTMNSDERQVFIGTRTLLRKPA